MPSQSVEVKLHQYSVNLSHLKSQFIRKLLPESHKNCKYISHSTNKIVGKFESLFKTGIVSVLPIKLYFVH